MDDTGRSPKASRRLELAKYTAMIGAAAAATFLAFHPKVMSGWDFLGMLKAPFVSTNSLPN
jgi:hypothetical protein